MYYDYFDYKIDFNNNGHVIILHCDATLKSNSSPHNPKFHKHDFEMRHHIGWNCLAILFILYNIIDA
jgi:hypothetical protein